MSKKRIHLKKTIYPRRRRDSDQSQRETDEHSLKVLEATFFDRPALKVARDLIGCCLHSKLGNQTQLHIITETEAYIGPQDLASHASKGRTKRTEAMFGLPGSFYVYFVLGFIGC